MALTPATFRADLKCGRGSISEGEKCTKGPAQRVQGRNGSKKFRNSAAKKALIAGAVTGAALAVGSGLAIRNNRRKAAQMRFADIKQRKARANEEFLSQLQTIARANEGRNNSRLQQASFRAAMQAKGFRDVKRREVRRSITQLKGLVPKSAARRRAAKRRDSVYAPGFTPDMENLSI